MVTVTGWGVKHNNNLREINICMHRVGFVEFHPNRFRIPATKTSWKPKQLPTLSLRERILRYLAAKIIAPQERVIQKLRERSPFDIILVQNLHFGFCSFVLLLMEEILHHLGYINLVNNGTNYISTGANYPLVHLNSTTRKIGLIAVKVSLKLSNCAFFPGLENTWTTSKCQKKLRLVCKVVGKKNAKIFLPKNNSK